jgi:hypothetical protein
VLAEHPPYAPGRHSPPLTVERQDLAPSEFVGLRQNGGKLGSFVTIIVIRGGSRGDGATVDPPSSSVAFTWTDERRRTEKRSFVAREQAYYAGLPRHFVQPQ